MALSIRGKDTNLGANFGVTSFTQTSDATAGLNPASSPLNLMRTESTSSGLANSDAVSTQITTPRSEAERKASSALLDASLSVSVKKETTQKLISTVDTLIAKTEELTNETNPTRKAQLKKEAEDLVATAQAEFEQAVAEDPSLAEDQTFTAIVKPGAAADDPDKTVTVTVAAAPSASSSGLTSLSFADANLQITSDSLESIKSALQSQVSAYDSTNTAISQAVQQRGIAAAASDQASNEPSAEEQANALAQKIKNAVNLEALQPVETLSIETLLSETTKPQEEASNTTSISTTAEQAESVYKQSNLQTEQQATLNRLTQL